MSVALSLYIGGVVVGLWRADARPATRVAIALLWPVGPLAFAVTIAVLVGAALVAFPVFGVAAVIAAITWGIWAL